MSRSRVVLGFGIALVAILLFAGFNNLVLNRLMTERIVINEDMIVEKDGQLYLVMPEQSKLELEMPTGLLEEVVFGNPYSVSYSYHAISKKGHVLRVKVT